MTLLHPNRNCEGRGAPKGEVDVRWGYLGSHRGQCRIHSGHCSARNAHKQVPVEIGGQVYLGVSENLFDCVERATLREQQRGRSV
jgi:hypothetical protein